MPGTKLFPFVFFKYLFLNEKNPLWVIAVGKEHKLLVSYDGRDYVLFNITLIFVCEEILGNS